VKRVCTLGGLIQVKPLNEADELKRRNQTAVITLRPKPTAKTTARNLSLRDDDARY
jgi:hypothetical protein